MKTALFCGLAVLLAARVAEAAERRFAILVGNDRGGGDTRPLRYATEDARRMHDVLIGHGRVMAQDARLLLDRDAGYLLRVFDEVASIVGERQRQGDRTLVFFYYSGHAKQGQLRMGDSRLDMSVLAERLKRSGADLTLAVVDACQSGELAGSKGVRKGPAFAVEAMAPDAPQGLVILTSSAGDEDSQESDAIGGSYFSHHLMAALRGAADQSGDKKVTLQEAYSYAQTRTLADTTETAAGAQHAAFKYDLKGHGDVVLTFLAEHREVFILPAQAPAGPYFLVDPTRGVVVSELWKPQGVERWLAVPPGRYIVKRRLTRNLRVGEVTVPEGGMAILDESRLRDVPFSDDPVKGALDAMPLLSRLVLMVGLGVQSFFDDQTRKRLFPDAGLLSVDVELFDHLARHWVIGGDLVLGGVKSQVDGTSVGAPLPFRMSVVNLGSTLSREFPVPSVPLRPFMGARLSVLSFARKFEVPDQHLPDQTFSTFSPGVVGGFRVRLAGALGLVLRGRLHWVVHNVGEKSRLLSYFDLGLLGSWEF